MELKEFMEREKLSEDDIIKAASIVTKVCKNGSCKNCPLYLFENCHAKEMTGDFIPATSRRFKKLLHPNHMDEVAKLLDIKLYNWFTATNAIGTTSKYQLTEKGLYDDGGLAGHGALTDLLSGKAYIVKEESKDE